jgi:hypothetical protein
MTGVLRRALMTVKSDRPSRPFSTRPHECDGPAIRGRVDPGNLDHIAGHISATLDLDPVFERTVTLRPTTQELGSTREAVLEAVVQRRDGSQKHAAEAYMFAEPYETIRVLS